MPLRRVPILLLVIAIYLWCPAGAAMGVPTAPSASEGTISLPLTRSAWMWSGTPVGRDNLVSAHALMEWYNARGVKERDLNPALHVYEGSDNEHQVLEMNVKPPMGEVALGAEDWTGIAQSLFNVGSDLSRVQFIEIWVNDFTPNHLTTQGNLKIDLGRVSEDAFWDQGQLPNGMLDTEDKNRDGRLDGGPKELAEDTGLDGLFDEDEPGYDPSINPDPNRDDYAYIFGSNDYSHINDFERNGSADPSRQPDTEDLNRNGLLDTDNNYFEAVIDLSDARYVAIDVAQLYAGDPDVKPDNGWRLFRVPISDSTFTRFGFATWDNVHAMRVWVDGVDEPVRLQIGGIFLRGEALLGAAPRVVLYQNYPNPFNPRTVIPYYLPEDGPARLVVFDVNGRLVYQETHAMQLAGLHEAVWTGRNGGGRSVGSGVYFYRLEAGGKRLIRRMVLAK